MNKNILIKSIGLFFLFLLLVGAGAYFYNDYTKVKLELNLLKTNPERLTQEQEKSLMDKLAKHVLLPKGEKPNIATVTNLEQLKDQPFFTNARIGDKLIVFMDARKAFLYNPSEDKVIEVGPLVVTTPDPSPAPITSIPPNQVTKTLSPSPTKTPTPTLKPTATPTPTVSPTTAP